MRMYECVVWSQTPRVSKVWFDRSACVVFLRIEIMDPKYQYGLACVASQD